MLATLPPSNEIAFFKIAVVLIPVLLFGGIAIDRLRPPPTAGFTGWHALVAGLIPAFGALAIGAEATAIQAVILGTSDTFSRILVVSAVVLGMLLIIAATASPWVVRLRPIDRRVFWTVLVGSVVLILTATVSAIPTLVDSIRVAGQTKRIRQESHRAHQAKNRLTNPGTARLIDRFARLSEKGLPPKARLKLDLDRQKLLLREIVSRLQPRPP
jgi:hypothetical protein